MTPLQTDYQTLFDLSARTLRAQGKQAYESGCQYRTYDGSKGIGAVLPDDVARVVIDKGFNGRSIKWIIRSAEMGDVFDVWNAHQEFLANLQEVHDTSITDHDAFWISHWNSSGIAYNFLKCAERFNLNVAVVHECWPKKPTSL
jgi:hypothetical protein